MKLRGPSLFGAARQFGRSRAGAILTPPDHWVKVRPVVFDPENSGKVIAAWTPLESAEEGQPPGHALYLAKTDLSATFSFAAALIDGIAGWPIANLTELGFDYRNDSHCGIRAPRFNIDVDGVGYFLLHSSGLLSKAPYDPDHWTRVRFSWANFAHTKIPSTGVINMVSIVFDEGIDRGPGFVYIDNIDINGQIIAEPSQVSFLAGEPPWDWVKAKVLKKKTATRTSRP